jgi:hypothetical protein
MSGDPRNQAGMAQDVVVLVADFGNYKSRTRNPLKISKTDSAFCVLLQVEADFES